MQPFQLFAAETATGRDAHVDAPLSNLAVEAFAGRDGMIAADLVPVIPVGKQSDKYFVIDPDTWLQVPNDQRGPLAPPRAIEWKVASDAYFAPNFALRTLIPREDLTNADAVLQLRQRGARFVVDALLRAHEVRWASTLTNTANMGASVALSASEKFSNTASANPLVTINSLRAGIIEKTGLLPNVAVMDWKSYEFFRIHPTVRDTYKYTGQGPVPTDAVRELLQVDQLFVPSAVKQNAREGGTSSITNIWGNVLLFARIDRSPSPMNAGAFAAFRWTPAGFPAAFAADAYPHPDPGVKGDYIEAGYFQAEKVLASTLLTGAVATL